MRRSAPRAALGLAIAAALVAAPQAPAALPVDHSFPGALIAGMRSPNASPPGANDWSCRPSTRHPRPVVLVHGTAENMLANWRALSPQLANAGYCVFALNFGAGRRDLPFRGLGPIAASAGELKAFVDRVRAGTGAGRVDIVGHSQGGMMPRHYLRFLDGDESVHALVALSPSNHGTTALGLNRLMAAIPRLSATVRDQVCTSCTDQLKKSAFLTTLNAGGDTVAGVRYTVIQTRNDVVVTRYDSAFLRGPGVDNILVQDGCIFDQVDHLAISYDRRALGFVLNALDPRHATRPPCRLALPLIGS